MSDANDVTGYQGGSDASGKGGRARERTIMGAVDNAAGGGSQSSNAAPPAPTKQHPAAYKPTPTERASRNYGAPIDTPILGSGS